jgi:hypothetical protein
VRRLIQKLTFLSKHASVSIYPSRFVIVDEASQALEGEAMLAAELAAPRSGTFCLDASLID